MKDAYCSHCGTAQVATAYPKTCPACGIEAWDNPLPVVVCVQPVHDPVAGTGIMIAQRAIAPKLGEWALLGGHMENNGETIEEAAQREFLEETGLALGANPRITASYANGRGHVLISVEAEPISRADFQGARLCPENSAFDILRATGRIELGFPIHQTIANRWFDAQ